MRKRQMVRAHDLSRRAGACERVCRGLKREEGATLVETAVSISIVLLLMFGVFDFALLFYSYHYVSDAAREGTRWAMVRGSKSCTNTPNLDVCQAGDTTGATTADISAYVAGCGASTSSGAGVCGNSSVTGLDYPGIDSTDHMKVTTTYQCKNTYSGATGQTWSTCGSGATQNAPGDQVTVKVVYTFPLSVPFWRMTGLGIQSTSSMVIAQ